MVGDILLQLKLAYFVVRLPLLLFPARSASQGKKVEICIMMIQHYPHYPSIDYQLRCTVIFWFADIL